MVVSFPADEEDREGVCMGSGLLRRSEGGGT